MNRLMLSLWIFLQGILAMGQSANERDANQHFKTANYLVALKMYNDLYKSDTTNVEYAYRLGVCHLNTNNDPAKSLKYLEKAQAKYSSDVLFVFEFGKAYLYNQQFDKALEQLKKACQMSEKNAEFKEICQLYAQMAENAKKYYQSPADVSFINLGKYINSPLDESTPMISPDGESLFYTSNNKYDSKFFYYSSDVFMSAADDGEFEKGRAVAGVNSIDDEFLSGLSMNGEHLYFQMVGYEAYQDIVMSTLNGKAFQGKAILGQNVNSKELESGVCESVNGDTLIFSSAGHNSMGGLDLFYCLKLPTGDWSEPRNLGPSINTVYDEDFPVLSANGSELFFTSNGPASMGGYDVFKVSINPETKAFGAPRNLGYPLNDVFDNKTIAYSLNQRYAFVSAIRPDGFGGQDIYRVVFNQEDPSVKIFIIKLLTGTPESNKPFAASDTTLKVTAFTKGKVVFGQYAYDAKGSQVAVALPPGQYTIEITGDAIKTEELKITVPDTPGAQKIEKKSQFIQLK